MASPFPITAPAGYAPAFALGYADPAGDLSLVAQTAPLPVQIMNTQQSDAPPPALEGTAGGLVLAGPFRPAPGVPVVLTLWGEWEGSVQLERKVAAGPRLPITVAGSPWARFAANACEPVWVESEQEADLYLGIAITSGTLNYRIAQ